MAIKFTEMKNFSIHCTDEEVGKVKDILFDELSGEVRYILIDTSKWLPGRKVLIKPDLIKTVDDKSESIKINLSKEKLKDSPPLESHLPVSRQYEESLHTYYGLTPYWGTTTLQTAGWFPYPAYPVGTSPSDILSHRYPTEWHDIQERRKKLFDNHLRSCDEVCGYKIATTDDEEFGEVSDVIIDHSSDRWLMIDLILSSRRWLPGGKTIACSPQFIEEIDEKDELLHVVIRKQILLDSPEFDFDKYGEKSRKELVNYYLEHQSSTNPKHQTQKSAQTAHT